MAKPAGDALAFASYMAYLTRLDSGVMLAWMASENIITTSRNGGDDGNARPSVPENWLNIAINGSIMRGSPGSLYDTPSSAAKASSDFIHGKTVGGWDPGPINTQGILHSASQNVNAQMQAINASGWVGAGVGYGDNIYRSYQLYRGYAPKPGPPGSSVGVGGSGTTANDVGQFYVNTTSKVQTDYWTALNNWGQQANWYVFSDGEILYIADGYILGQQTPAAIIGPIVGTEDPDRRILSFGGTLDNTSFQYFMTHKRRQRYQRKTEMARIQSPTQLIIDWICKIDEIRAGDLVHLVGAGPFEGPWLVGNCTRSIFDIFSELTLVPTLVPIKPGSTITTRQSATGIVSSHGYTNPFQKINNLVPERVDMGVDYGGSGTIVAIGSGKINQIRNGGWPGGAFIEWKLSGGAYAGKYVYFAEHITPSVHVGQNVNTGDPIGTMTGGIECGWGIGNGGNTLAQKLGTSTGSNNSTRAGVSFNNFLKATGAKSGIVNQPIIGGTLPGGYP